MTPRIFTVFLVAATASCSSAPDRYYTLMPAGRPASAASTSTVERVVVVGPVTVPAVLNQTQLVLTGERQQMDVREAERWAAPFREEFTGALAARLEALLPQMAVAVHQQSAATDAGQRIEIDVSRFDLGPGRQTQLEVLWAVRSEDPMAERRGRTRIAETAQGEGFEALAAAQGRALDRLAQTLAAAVVAAAR